MSGGVSDIANVQLPDGVPGKLPDGVLDDAQIWLRRAYRELLAINTVHQRLFACRTVQQVCQTVTDALVERFDAVFARVWLVKPADRCDVCDLASCCQSREKCLHLMSSSGIYEDIHGRHRRVPLGAFKIGLIAEGRGKTISNDVVSDERIHDRQWAQQLKLKSFAGLPLEKDGAVVGVMAMFSRSELGGHLLETLELLAHVVVAALTNVQQMQLVEEANSELERRVQERTAQHRREIQWRRRIQKDLEQATMDAQAASRAKSSFLANMSHEIRTPLNSILGFADLLRQDTGQFDAAERRDFAETIFSSSQHLLSLINDVLDVSKIEAGRMEFSLARCSPVRVISQVASTLRVRAQEKNISLVVEFRGPIPETICTDPARLRQLLMNLVGNAIKFTQTGKVRIVTRMRRQGEHDQMVTKVIDTGPGIPPANLNSVFDPFVQADTSYTRRLGGTGLGLAISRCIAEGLGGTLTVSSKLRQGSTFTLTLDPGPLEGVPMTSGQEVVSYDVVNDQAALPVLQGRILLVEDGEPNRKLIRLILERAGAEVVEAENGRVAVDLAALEPFDAILMDMQMPVMDGYAATTLLRRKGLKIPIVALTAHAMHGDEERCLAVGCTDYLSKPVIPDRLVLALADVLETVDKPAPLTPQRLSARRSSSALYGCLPRDDPMAAELHDHFVQWLSEMMQSLRSAHAVNDLVELSKLAHSLKGCGGTYGYDSFTSPAAELQLSAQTENHERIAELLRDLENLTQRIASSL